MLEANIIYYLLNFGVLGVWTYRLIKKEDANELKTTQVIENNTKALTLVYENIKHCQSKKKAN